jgi:GT2 family glycosyltransferase
MQPGISIVIPVHNGAAYLAQCLQAVRDLRPAPLECIVVDDGSTDGSAAIARAAGIPVISTPGRRGPAFARNRGAAAARGEILLFVDADVMVPPDALARLAARFAEDPARDAVIGSYDHQPASPDFLSQYRNLLHCYTHQCGHPRTCAFWTGCGAIRNAAFLAHGGFDETRTRPCLEDIELGLRLRQAGRQIWLDKDLQVKHLKRLRFWTVLKIDIADRAIPWTRLILRFHQMPADLNLMWGQRFSVLASGWTLLALLLAAVFALSSRPRPAIALALSAALAACAVAALNRGFYGFLVRVRGLRFALGAFPLHCLYFLCGGAGFAIGLAAHQTDLWRAWLVTPEHRADPSKPAEEIADPATAASACPAIPPHA